MYGRFLVLIFAALLVTGGFVFPETAALVLRSSAGERAAEEALIENVALRAALIASPQTSSKVLEAAVHAVYPFTNKGLITVAAGEDKGVRAGAPVTIGGEVLVGRVHDVFSHYSTVQTVFDADWKMPVRIGDERVDALMIGGNTITLVMVEKEARVHDGDVVVAAAQGVPYGIGIGEVEATMQSETSVFQQARVAVPYRMRSVQSVVILNDY